MRKLIILTAVILSGFACSGQKDGIAIEGTVDNPAGTTITLQKYGQEQVSDIATAELKTDNAYSFPSVKAEPGFYRLNFFDAQFVNLIINDSDLEVNVDGSQPTGKVEIKGSKEMDQLNSARSIMQQFQEEMNRLNSEYSAGIQGGDATAFTRLQELQEKYSSKIKTEIRSMGSSIASLQAIAYLDPEHDLQFIDSVVNEVAKANPNLEEAKQIRSELEGMKKLAIGGMAPDFSLPDTTGTLVSLSSHQGKYVLVDFWAAWCRPCRMENPNLVAAYQKYKDKGFEIFGVSLDQDDPSWIQAINKDGLLWKQVRDVKNQAASLYNISAIPMNFLLDKEGRIIDKNLRGQALEAKLEDLF